MKYLFLFLFPFSLAAQKNLPLKLWYKQPAHHFEEALLLGNGKIGATVFGDTNTDKILLNDITLWSGEPVDPNMNLEAKNYLPKVREALSKENYKAADSLMRKIQGKYSESFAPLGTLFIDFKNQNSVENYHRELNLHEATATITYNTADNTITREYFTSYPDQVFVIRIKSKKPIDFAIRQTSLLKHSINTKGNISDLSGRAPYRAYPIYYRANDPNAILYDDQRGTAFTSKVKIIGKDGHVSAEDSTLQIAQTTDALIIVAMATSFNGFDKDPAKNGLDEQAIALKNLTNATKKEFNQLKTRHIDDYKSYFNRVKLDLKPDNSLDIPTDERLLRYATGLEDRHLETLYFQFGRYLLISSSRTPGVPANLQGLWNPYIRPPWSSNYTTNINLEENYWLAENTNLAEMHQPLLSFIGNLAQTGKHTAKNFYGADGWSLAHNSDIWALTNPVGDFGNGHPVWANWSMGGTWVATHLWEHYLFNQDKTFLKNYAYPLMKGAAEFCIDMLIEDKDGYLITSPSTSPENTFITPTGYHGATLYGATADLSMIRDLFSFIIEAGNILKIDQPFIADLQVKLEKIRPYQIGKKGNLQEWYYDWEDAEPQHRHQTHLYGLYPGHNISVKNTPQLAQAAKKTLEIKGDETTGWSKGWRINLWARLLDGNHAYKMYRELLKYVAPDAIRPRGQNHGGTYPNLLDAHPPFQIDGNFGGAAGVAEMLIQSDEHHIYLLPALPDAWKNGEVYGLRVRGGFEVDIKWQNGKLSQATIYAKPGGRTTLIYGNKEKSIKLKKGKKFTFKP